MGLAVVERREGSLVWVQTKNATLWWPGIILNNKPPISDRHVTVSGGGDAPVQLLPPATSSSHYVTEWFNLEKSRRIKAFRSGEFRECILKVESNKTHYPKGIITYGRRREEAIRHALQLEEEMQKKFKKREASGEREAGIVPQIKRSRNVSMPADKNCVSDCPPQSNLVQGGISDKPSNSVSSKSGSYVPNTQETRLSVVDALSGALVSRLSKNKGETENAKAEKNPISKVSSKFPPQRKEKVHKQQKAGSVPNSLKPLLNVEKVSKTRNGKLYKSAYNGACSIDTIDTIDTTLIDVEVTVRASPRGNHVPLVCLMSKVNGKAMIGYPINIEKASDCKIKLMWQKRRTPVYYVSKPQHSPGPKNIDNTKNHLSGPVVTSCVPVKKIFCDLLHAVGEVGI